MTEDPVKIVEAVYDAFQRRDTEAPFEFYAPDIEWDASRGMLGAGVVYHGHDGVRENFRDLFTAFSSIDFEVEEIVETGGHVLATIRESYVGRMSEVEVDRKHYAVWSFEEGKITRLQVFLDRDQALEAAAAAG